jgi:hypothetical protein
MSNTFFGPNADLTVNPYTGVYPTPQSSFLQATPTATPGMAGGWVDPSMMGSQPVMPGLNPTFLDGTHGTLQGLPGAMQADDGNNLAFWNTLIDGE